MKVYPVIHIQSPEQALHQAEVATAAEADGVFLISHRGGSLIDSYNKVRSEIPDLYVGLNYLSHDPLRGYAHTADMYESGEIDKLPNALWFDDAVSGTNSVEKARAYLAELEDYRNSTTYLKTIRFLGGVSFKYTRGYADGAEESAESARNFSNLIDVVTTSGAGTGKSPSPNKISAMKDVVGDKPLAIASGVDEYNIEHYSGSVDEILVASSLETFSYSGEFIPSRVRSLIDLAHRLD